MARARGIIIIIPGPEFEATQVALRIEDERIPRAAVDRIRDEAEGLVLKAQRRVRKLQINPGPEGHTGIRQRVAAGVSTKPMPGGVRVTTSMTNRDEAIIPRGMDRASGWIHPLFDQRNKWFRNTPVRPGWFMDTMADGRSSIQEALTDELERSADNIDHAS